MSGLIGLAVVGIIVLIIVLFLLVTNIRVVPQAHAYVLERLGGYKETWSVGIHFKVRSWTGLQRRFP